jgi:hypothetical protein
MVNTKFATESHPAILVPFHVYVPLVVYTFPFQLYDEHAETLSIETLEELMVNTKFATESHASALNVWKL